VLARQKPAEPIEGALSAGRAFALRFHSSSGSTPALIPIVKTSVSAFGMSDVGGY